MGKLTINGPFSIAMLVYQRVIHDLLDGAQSVEKVGFPGLSEVGSSRHPLDLQSCGHFNGMALA